jgi:CHAD domain-containing protein
MAGGGVDALHQSRVCVRRLRAIVLLFRPALGWDDGKAVQAELKWLSDLLGDARALDVFVNAVLTPIAAANPDAPGFAPLLAAFHTRRERAYAAIAEGLRSSRLLELSLDLVARFDGLLMTGVLQGEAARRRKLPIGRFLAKQLKGRLTSLLRASRAIERMEPAAQHRVRIRAKKLRYMIEPFRELLSRKRFRTAVTCLQEIQDALGDLNDFNVNREIALAFAREGLADKTGDGSALFAAGLVAAGCRKHEKSALSRAIAARAKLAGVRALRVG